MLFAEVLLPLPLSGTFSYRVPDELSSQVLPGHRVIVPFGARKFYTGIVVSTGNIPPAGGFDIKEIAACLDRNPIIKRPQLQLWNWVADYYLCSPGDVLRAALPAALKVESETFIEANPDFDREDMSVLSERENVILQVLDHEDKRMKVSDIEKATGFTGVGMTATHMLEKGAVIISEKLIERYRSMKVGYISPAMVKGDTDALREAFEKVGKNNQVKQMTAFQALLQLSGFMNCGAEVKEVSQQEVMERTGLPRTVLKQLADKGIVRLYKKEINRFQYNGVVSGTLPRLSDAQQTALGEIHRSWLEKDVTLLHGVTSSGKTEIYIHLIDFVLRQGRQALFLVPEIALTTQLTKRLQRVFGDRVVIYHSKFSDNDRVDIYRKVLESNDPMVVIGARSAIFLPFSSLGLVIVDEEHESSYKQQDPAPRYNGRDTAMVLARMHGAKTLLGSASPAIDTYYKAVTGRYGFVSLTERYSGVALPKIELIDTNKERRKGTMSGPLAPRTIQLVKQAAGEGRQSILFLNRRGYAPVATCKMCAFTPKCEHCDVSLTYHKGIDKLVCHYCGAVYPLPTVCPACREPAMEIYGYGTERMEDEIEKTFGPDVSMMRMDLDTTRNKDGYENLINDFSQGKAQILVGTQMVTKGLDFGNVSTVGIINADALINQPDFRAAERAFNMMLQVAGRAGRRGDQGVVAIQTRRTDDTHILPYVMAHDYEGFYRQELEERRKFNYPPFTRVIYIYLKHRDRHALDELAVAYGRRLRTLFGNRVFGPEEPSVARIQSLFIRKLMIKIEIEASMKKVKEILRQSVIEMRSSGMSAAKSAIVYYDVDPY
ncbi:MAG: primosomal protein N' [Bacteroides sp.]|nr:primosomal protein N' [Bacteroides sp.]MCM1412831.1 primosomal protein N' [Bacteroides sp.]MCM1471500.1 primosomal protein N' [Bacteroides sp.]